MDGDEGVLDVFNTGNDCDTGSIPDVDGEDGTNSQGRDFRIFERNRQGEDLRGQDKKDQEVCLNCALLNGFSFRTEKAYIEQCREDLDVSVFFGIEHRMNGDEATQQFNKLAKKK